MIDSNYFKSNSNQINNSEVTGNKNIKIKLKNSNPLHKVSLPEHENRKVKLIIKNSSLQKSSSPEFGKQITQTQEISKMTSRNTPETDICSENRKRNVEKAFTQKLNNSDEIDQNLMPEVMKKLEAIEKKILNLTKNKGGDLPVERYKDFAKEYSKIKLMLDIQNEFFNKITFSEQLLRVKFLLEIIHPYPLDENVKNAEIEIFQKILAVCNNVISRNASDDLKNQARALKDQVSKKELPLFMYNFAAWKSSVVSAEIDTISREILLAKENGDVESVQSNWNGIIELYNEEIERFAHAKVITSENEHVETSDYCSSALAESYERLADTYLDLISDFDPADEVQFLEKALKFYEKAKTENIQLKELDNREIEYSILNVRYNLAIRFKENNDINQYSDQIQHIKQYVDKNFKGNTFVNTNNSDLIFYKLAVLEALYNQNNDENLRDEAIQFLKRIAHDPFIEKDNTSIKLDVVNWLKSFARSLRADSNIFPFVLPEDFTMASVDEPNYIDKRRTQLFEGVNNLMSNYASKYKITLRDHQTECYSSLLNHIMDKKDCLNGGYFCLPTGAGKTLIMILLSLAVKMPTLIIVPTTTLMDQTIKEIKKVDPNIRVSRFDRDAKDRFSGQIMVTTYQSLERSYGTNRIPLDAFGMIFADEAHCALTVRRSAIMSKLRESTLVFGFTATKEFNLKRVKGAFSHVNQAFGEEIYTIDLLDLIERKVLTPVKNVIVNVKQGSLVSRTKRKKKSADDAADYTKDELINFTKAEYVESVADFYLNEYDHKTKEEAFGKSGLIFSIGIMHGEAIADCLNKKISEKLGKRDTLYAACVHSELSRKKQMELINLHKAGEILVLVGDSIFNEGYDNPKDSLILNVCPTRSIVRAKQRAGRGIRIDLQNPHKLAWVVDFVYPELENQVLFSEFLDGKYEAGLEETEEEIFQELPTAKYSVVWPGVVYEPQNNHMNVDPMRNMISSAQPQRSFKSRKIKNNYTFSSNNYVNNSTNNSINNSAINIFNHNSFSENNFHIQNLNLNYYQNPFAIQRMPPKEMATGQQNQNQNFSTGDSFDEWWNEDKSPTEVKAKTNLVDEDSYIFSENTENMFW